MAERRTADEHLERDESFELANEFAAVTVTKVRTRNGERLEIHSPRADALIRLDPLEVEALALQDPELFTRLVGHRSDEVEGK